MCFSTITDTKRGGDRMSTSTTTRRRYPSPAQFETFVSQARTQKRGLGRILTAAGYTLIEGTTGRNRKHWTR